jgi:hypothetical protein
MPTTQSNPPLTLTLSLDLFADSLQHLRSCVEPIPDTRFAEQFPALVNHPAWSLGHLITSAAFALVLLDTRPSMQLSLDSTLYGPGSVPTPNRSTYPAKDALLNELASIHDQLAQAVLAHHDTHFAKPAPEAIRASAPTVGRVVMYLLTCHEPYHIAQVVQWKKAAGLA